MTERKQKRSKLVENNSETTSGSFPLSSDPAQQARYNPQYPYTRDPHLGQPDQYGRSHTNVHRHSR